MKKYFLIFILFLLNPVPLQAFTLSHFESPESVVVDPEDGSYYVSNVNGLPSLKDGNGYISRINRNGSLVIQKYIGGKDGILDAPKGLALIGKELFVADIDSVKVFNKKTKKLVRNISLTEFNVKFLNDLAVDPQGVIYASETTNNQIFKINTKKNYEATLYKQGRELGHPNGLLFNPKSKELMVLSWETGQLLEIDYLGRIHVLKKGLKTLDGMDYDGDGNLYVSSFDQGEIYKIPYFGRGAVSTYLSGLRGPADICFDRKKEELIIPSFTGNTVSTLYKRKERLAEK